LGFESELANIRRYIDNFDPMDFSTDTCLLAQFDPEKQRKTAKKLKARLQRRRKMEQYYLSIKYLDYDDSDVSITQEEIDEVLGKM